MSGFRVYATTDQRMPLSQIADHARRAERLGYDGLALPDSVHDAITAATVALASTERIRVATSVLVCFPRSPMTVAMAAWDLQEMSGGRFELGLGSQVRGNIEKRYSTPWSAPVDRMREYVGALRAIFECWEFPERKLAFEGEHYRFTRMQPFFKPDVIEQPRVPIYLGGVGPKMIGLSGESADGLMTHPTNTAPRYLREVVIPRMRDGAELAGRAPGSILVSPLPVTGRDARSVDAERERVRGLLGFLYSTPAYWPCLELFGWRDRGEALHRLTREGKWDEMTAVIDDEMLETIVPVAPYPEIAGLLKARFEGLTDWLSFPMPDDPQDDSAAVEVIAALRSGS